MGATKKPAPTELAIGDVVLWKTPKGSAALWVFQRKDMGGGVIPVLELLDWVGDAFPEDGASLPSAKSPRPPLTPMLEAHRWFLAQDLVHADDPKGRWRRVRSGFKRASFVPSKASEHGLGAPFLEPARIHSEVASFVANKVSGKDALIATRAIATQAAETRAKATPSIEPAPDAWAPGHDGSS